MKALSLPTFVAGFALLLCPTLLHAQTWISGLGDDANSGSRSTPLLTLTKAVIVTAAGGTIFTADSGSFGTATIRKTVTLHGVAAPIDINAGALTALTISAGATDVVILRNISLKGNGGGAAGISIVSAGAVVIENCHISGFVDGIRLATSAAGTKLTIRNTTISNCSTSAVNLVPTAAASIGISGCSFFNCGLGVSAGATASVDITDTLSTGHSGPGFTAAVAGASMLLTRCASIGNAVGIHSSANVFMSDCSVFNNTGAGLEIDRGNQVISYSNNSVLGNTPNGSPTSTASPQ